MLLVCFLGGTLRAFFHNLRLVTQLVTRPTFAALHRVTSDSLAASAMTTSYKQRTTRHSYVVQRSVYVCIITIRSTSILTAVVEVTLGYTVLPRILRD